MIGVVHYTPSVYVAAPYWPCCQVIGHPGETACWVCERATAPAPPPSLHTSTGSVLLSEFPDDPPVDRLIERKL